MGVVMKLAFGITLGALIGMTAACFAGAIPLSPAHAQTVSGDATGTGAAVVVGTGGSQPNQNDICWILFREKAKDKDGKDYERTSLCLYRSMGNGQLFDLVDTRDITYDGKIAQLHIPGHNPGLSPQTIKDKWDDAVRKEKERQEKEKNAKK